ncbi:hypothetical protein FOXB_17590 [Fusarium oxysporum f. sp. conglutinans Fo5176]|uniref:Uncharacterized protein n=1 Tax=Fusarium oxysporum (strain Fo5176) TaxID=660025 RepID=F9GG06_FUSOF|nr:hypothetical protein FOXB_17590 [Fusarium oxysporum f. sp. conglutinans Fo5176]
MAIIRIPSIPMKLKKNLKP